MYGATFHQILCMSYGTLWEYLERWDSCSYERVAEWQEMSPWTQTAWSDMKELFAQYHVLYIIGWPEFEKGLNPRD